MSLPTPDNVEQWIVDHFVKRNDFLQVNSENPFVVGDDSNKEIKISSKFKVRPFTDMRNLTVKEIVNTKFKDTNHITHSFQVLSRLFSERMKKFFCTNEIEFEDIPLALSLMRHVVIDSSMFGKINGIVTAVDSDFDSRGEHYIVHSAHYVPSLNAFQTIKLKHEIREYSGARPMPVFNVWEERPQRFDGDILRKSYTANASIWAEGSDNLLYNSRAYVFLCPFKMNAKGNYRTVVDGIFELDYRHWNILPVVGAITVKGGEKCMVDLSKGVVPTTQEFISLNLSGYNLTFLNTVEG